MFFRVLIISLLFTGLAIAFPHEKAFAYDDEAAFENYNKNDASEVYDPLERMNRGVYRFNTVLDKYMLKPVAKGYRKVVPLWGRERVHSFLRNLGEPVVFANAVLQADKDRAFTSFWRFVINSTWGVGGMFDIAGQEGLRYRDEDFGQTLGVYGVGSGPYLVLPLFGPSNPRDAVGKVADYFMDPFNYALEDEEPLLWARYGVSTIDTREYLLDITDEIEATSFDPYATVRSVYVQNRKNKIRNGAGSSE